METGLVLPAGAFLFTLALVGWLLWRMERKIRTVRPVFPQWGVKLKGMSERVATATGKCDSCGGRVVGES